jgi:metal-responsive CopG/Arc/MetJ family transcriptional regulator
MSSELDNIVSLLERASKADFYYNIRKRYASTEQWKHEEKSIRRAATIYWFSAKKLICANMAEVEMKSKEIPIIEAALKVIKKESDQKFEALILKGGNMGRVKSQEELFDILDDSEELDEDALYASETEGSIDEDDNDGNEDAYDDSIEEYVDIDTED